MKHKVRVPKPKSVKMKKKRDEPEPVNNTHEDSIDEAISDSSANEDQSDHSPDLQSDADKSDSPIQSESDKGFQSSDEMQINDKQNDSSNPGWADAMQKILRTKKPKRKKTIAFSKAKKLSEIKPREETENISFEIDGQKEETEEKLEKENIESSGTSETRVKRQKKEPHAGIRVKPSINDRERERMLQRIATKGVVQLFNAVKQQQIEIDKKLTQAGPLDRKREKALKNVDKRAFLDALMGGTKSISVDEAKSEKSQRVDSETKDDKMWNVLRDDFVMGVQMKNWDKRDDENDDTSEPEEIDSDD